MTAIDDEPISLSAHALAALAEFTAERDAREKEYERLRALAEVEKEEVKKKKLLSEEVRMDAFEEDWNESQFWYADETARLLADQLLEGATPQTTIAVVSTPSVFVALKNLLRERGVDEEAEAPRMVLLEHDRRFGVFPEFVFYDFQQPLKLPGNLKGSVDRVICDPPFLSEDCQTKTALTVRWLLKAGPSPKQLDTPGNPNTRRLLMCTGERMRPLLLKLYHQYGLKTTTYEPVHARGLSNEFLCYANFESPHWTWLDVEDP